MFQSYATYYNIVVKSARDANDPDKGAEFGIGPLPCAASRAFSIESRWLVNCFAL